MPYDTKAQQVYEQTKPLYQAGEYQRCVTLLQKVFSPYGAAKNPSLYHSIANRLGNSYSSLGNLPQAEAWYSKAFELAKLSGSASQLYGGYNNLATVYVHTNRPQLAVEYLQKSIEIKEQSGQPEDTGPGLLQISGLFFKLENMEAGKKALAQARVIIRKHKQLPLYAPLYFATAMMLKREQQPTQACKKYDLAIKHAKQHKDFALVARCYSNKAQVLIDTKKWVQAHGNLSAALYVVRQHNIQVDELVICCQLALVSMERKRYKTCRELLEYVRHKAPGIANDMVYETLEELTSRYYDAMGQPGKALQHYKSYLEYYKKEYNHQMSHSITDIQAKYENEKRERELQQATQSELNALRTQMNPHFIFNALSGIRQSVLEENSEEADRLIMRFSKLLRLILDTSRKPVIPLSQNIELLHLYIQIEQSRQNNRFNYNIVVDKGLNPDITLVHGLVLQPLVENSILHGLFHKTEGEGRLDISFSKTPNKLCVHITDNGVGREKAAGFRKKEHQSHATDMIRETLQLLWKTTDIKPYFQITDLYNKKKEPAGTSVKVFLPLKYTTASIAE